MQQIHQVFPASFNFIVAANSLNPDWQTITSHKISSVEMDRLWADPDLLVGIRPQKVNNYLLFDIDRYSKYHPAVDRNNWDSLLFRLEQLGLIDPTYIRSSHNGGIHIYYWFAEAIESFKLAALTKVWLEDDNFVLAKGQIESFPNTKSYDSNYNAHRLPLQFGSILLDQYGDPLDDPANCDQQSRLEYFIDCARSSQQSIATIKSRLKWGYDRYLKSKYSRTRSGVNVNEWRQDWAETIANGWTGRGQTNKLLHVIVGNTIVFEGIDRKPELFDRVKSIVLAAPGYYQHCNHQHKIDRRIWDWINLTIDRNYYTPYQSRPARTGEYPGSTIDKYDCTRPRSTTQHDSIVDRIKATIQAIIDRFGELPKKVRDRITAIVNTSRELFGVGFGVNTLYKSCYSGLWQSAEMAETRNEAETQKPVGCSQFCDRESDRVKEAETQKPVGCSQFSVTMKLNPLDRDCNMPTVVNLPQMSANLSPNTFSSGDQQPDPDLPDRAKSLQPQGSILNSEQVQESHTRIGSEPLEHISSNYELKPSAKFSHSISCADESRNISLECPGSIDLELESKLLPPVRALVIRPQHRYQGKIYPTISGTITANFGISCELICTMGHRYRFDLCDWLVSWFPDQ